MPSRFGRKGARTISILLHILSSCSAILIGIIIDAGIFFFVGVALYSVLLTAEQIVARPGDKKSINMAFATINSYAGVIFVVFAITDILLGI